MKLTKCCAEKSKENAVSSKGGEHRSERNEITSSQLTFVENMVNIIPYQIAWFVS